MFALVVTRTVAEFTRACISSATNRQDSPLSTARRACGPCYCISSCSSSPSPSRFFHLGVRVAHFASVPPGVLAQLLDYYHLPPLLLTLLRASSPPPPPTYRGLLLLLLLLLLHNPNVFLATTAAPAAAAGAAAGAQIAAAAERGRAGAILGARRAQKSHAPGPKGATRGSAVGS